MQNADSYVGTAVFTMGEVKGGYDLPTAHTHLAVCHGMLGSHCYSSPCQCNVGQGTSHSRVHFCILTAIFTLKWYNLSSFTIMITYILLEVKPDLVGVYEDKALASGSTDCLTLSNVTVGSADQGLWNQPESLQKGRSFIYLLMWHKRSKAISVPVNTFMSAWWCFNMIIGTYLLQLVLLPTV